MITYQSPGRLLFIIFFYVFITEAFIMILLSVIPSLPTWMWAMLDATLLVILLSPALYFFVLRPLMQHLTERKLAEDKAELAYAELSQIFNTAADGMRLIDKDFNVLRVNDTFSTLSGVSRGEATGKKCHEVFHGPMCFTPDCPLTRILGGEKRVEYEVEKERKDGTKIPCIVTGTPFRGPGGELIGIVEDFKDITERKQAEREVRSLKQQMEFILGATKTGLDIIDSEFSIRYIDPEWQKIYGDPTGRKCYEYFMGRSEMCPVCGIPKALETKTITVTEEVLVKEDNRPIQVTTIPFQNEKGEWLVAEVNVDITDRKKAEESLRESEGKLNAMLQSIGDHMSMMDKDLNIIWANDTAKKIFGEDIVGKKCYEVYHGRKEPCKPYPCLTLKAFRDGKVHEHDTSVTDKDGDTVYFHCTANVALRDDKGNPAAVIEISRDITKNKQAEEKLLIYQEQLRSFASQLSLIEERERRRIATELHDHIGQTLALCKIKLGVMRELTSSPLATSMDEVRSLIEQTIQYTRSLTFEISPPILYELGYEAAVEWLGEKILRQHGILFNFKNDEHPKPLNDEARIFLFQAVRELLVNIVKHAKANHVTVFIKRDDDNVRVSVEDDGIGFEVSKTDSYLNKSSGFGFFSIHERLKYIKGYINVESEPGHGTHITIVVPLELRKLR